MTLIKSISGIRGTIGGYQGEGLSPIDAMKSTAAYAVWIKSQIPHSKIKIVVGRDARISGKMLDFIVCGTLMAMGIEVININMTATPTAEIAVINEQADGGIILTASHNPKEWNALKLLNNKGEFISDKDGKMILEIAENGNYKFSQVDEIGNIRYIDNYEEVHIQKILALPVVDVEAIKNAKLVVAIDCVNSVGGFILPKLLEQLGVQQIIEIFCTPNGNFPHNPEPLPEHLETISQKVKEHNAHLGFVVDPDVDRLAIINEDGTMFGEEYTLVACADYILQHKKGNTVSNLSSTRALRDITLKAGASYFASAVGEVNVVALMKQVDAVIGGEGNGGIIYPELHYGRDALVGIALFLSHLAKSNLKCSQLRNTYPNYYISKNKVTLPPSVFIDDVLVKIADIYKNKAQINTIDGVKIDFNDGWIHLRKSNTEPIVRIYAEATSPNMADKMAQQIINELSDFLH